MKIAIFGLAVSSSWGNGHATLWRGLCRALGARGHRIVFLERDVPYYAGARDLYELPGGGELVLYRDWQDVLARARRELGDADVAIVTSYCPDALTAQDIVFESGALSVFYDLDTPVTLSTLKQGREPSYIGPRGLADFDLVLSYTGGHALEAMRELLHARHVEPLFGHVDPTHHRTVPSIEQYRCDLSYLGTFADDRQQALEELLIAPAEARPERKFLIGGARYPAEFPWRGNIFFVRHVPPGEHPAFFSSSRLTLNVTRRSMAEMGWCPSGRLFEAAACRAPIITDAWEGLDHFYAPDEEIRVARSRADILAALDLDDAELRRMADRAFERTMAEHTSERRADDLLRILERFGRRVPVAAQDMRV